MLESLAQEILTQIKGAPQVVLVLHRNPDPDSLGSVAAFSEFLNAQGVRFQYYCATALPWQATLFGIDPATVLTSTQLETIAAVAICVFDAGDLAHAGLQWLQEVTRGYKRLQEVTKETTLPPIITLGNITQPQVTAPFIINFDHHATNTRFGAINVVDTACASTTAVVYDFLKTLRAPVSPRLARYLLAGLLTDTDHFMNPATSAAALSMAAQLLTHGVSLSALRQILFEQRGIAGLQLIGEGLSRLQKNTRYGLAFTFVTDADARRYGVDLEQVADLANILNVIGDARAMLVIKSESGVIKVSMRTTRPDIDLAKLAEDLGGGGHRKAAGFRFRGTLQIEGGHVRVI